MGEITEALRRARRERGDDAPRRGSDLDEGEPRASGTRRTEEREPALPCAASDPVVRVQLTPVGASPARAVVFDERVAACYQQFALRVRPELEARGGGLMVTSALRHEGKTTTACNLAFALASIAAERRLALVDLDLHRPAVAAGLGIRPTVGFERVLEGAAPLEAARIRIAPSALDVYAVDRTSSHAHELFSSRRFAQIMQALAQAYDAIVFDTPPVLLVPDVGLITPHVGACVAVVRAGSTYRSAFRQMLKVLPEDRLIGILLNDTSLPRHTRSHGYYYDELGRDASRSDAAVDREDAQSQSMLRNGR